MLILKIQHLRAVVPRPEVLLVARKKKALQMKWADLTDMLQKDLDEFYVLLTVHLEIIVQKNQLDAQLILSIFRQTLHVSGASRSIIGRYNRMYTTTGTYYSF